MRGGRPKQFAYVFNRNLTLRRAAPGILCFAHGVDCIGAPCDALSLGVDGCELSVVVVVVVVVAFGLRTRVSRTSNRASICAWVSGVNPYR